MWYKLLTIAIILNLPTKLWFFMTLINLDNYKEEADPGTLHHLRWNALQLYHKELAVALKYTFTDVAGFLDLPVYNLKLR